MTNNFKLPTFGSIRPALFITLNCVDCEDPANSNMYKAGVQVGVQTLIKAVWSNNTFMAFPVKSSTFAFDVTGASHYLMSVEVIE